MGEEQGEEEDLEEDEARSLSVIRRVVASYHGGGSQGRSYCSTHTYSNL